MNDSPNTGHDPYGVWRIREYRLFSAGWLLWIMAGQIETIAVGIHVYAQTHTAMSLGWIGLAKALPVILLAIIAGQIADRYNRLKIMVVTFSLVAFSTAGLLALTWTGAPVEWFYLCLLAGSVGQALGSPARASILPQLVPMEMFSNAMAWNSSLFQIGTMIGPVAGGLLIGQNNYAPPALALALALRFCGLISIMLLKIQTPVRKAVDTSLSNLLAGIRFVGSNKIILATITLDLFAVLLGGATYLLPLFAQDILHVGGFGLGLLRAAEAVGAIAMAMTIAHLPPIKNAGRAMLWAVAMFGAATVLFGISQWFWLSMVAMVAIGACDNVSVIVRHTLVQVLTPDHMRGRVTAVNNVFIVSSNDLGGFESGLSARIFDSMSVSAGLAAPGLSSRIAGAVASVVFGGIGAAAAAVGCAHRWPEVLRLGSLRDIRPAGEPAGGAEKRKPEGQQ